MAFLKLIIGVILVFSTSLSWSQNSVSTHKNEPSRNIISSKKIEKVNQMYFEKTNLLKTYFIEGKIKNGFPGYNYSLSKEVNKNEISKWLLLGDNKSYLTKEGLLAIELYIKSK